MSFRPGPRGAPEPAAGPSLIALTSAVLGDPAHSGKQTVDVKMFAVKLSTLFFSEVSLLLETWLCVAGLKLHAASHTVLPSIFWPGERERTHTHCIARDSSPHYSLICGVLSPREASLKVADDRDSEICVCIVLSIP